MTICTRYCTALLLGSIAGTTNAALTEDAVNIGFFLEWATPNQMAKVNGAFDEAMGVPVNWINFNTGTAMTDALASGDLDIAYSQGLTPFATAVNADVPITMVAIAVAYSSSDDCFVRNDLGIDVSNAYELEGESVAVPLNTITDFGFRMTMKHLDVDTDRIAMVDVPPAEAARQLIAGSVAMACGFGADSMSEMQTVGTPLLTSEEKQEAGISSFDVVSVANRFLSEHPDRVQSFVDITSEANTEFVSGTADINVIAEDAGLSVEKARNQMSGFTFPTKSEQLNHYFSDDGIGYRMLKFVGQLYGNEDAPPLSDYNKTIDTQFLQ